MTIDELKGSLCGWVNSLGSLKAIKSPSSDPAPDGNYIAIGTGTVEQHGRIMSPGANDEENTKRKIAQHIAEVIFYEVEGEGDYLRNLKNLIQEDEFQDFINNYFYTEEDDFYHGFTVQDIGSISDISVQEKDFWINQRSLRFNVMFNDIMAPPVERMISVSGELNENEFSVSISEEE